jgi:hypothetical protein
MKAEDVPLKYRGIYERAMSGRSRKAAIRAYCLACCNWQANEVKLCTCPGCPCFPYRLTGSKSEDTPDPVPQGRKYLDGVGKWLSVYERALTGRDVGAAIRAGCLVCSSWSAAGVRECWDRACPLWPYRLKGRGTPTEAQKARGRALASARKGLSCENRIDTDGVSAAIGLPGAVQDGG